MIASESRPKWALTFLIDSMSRTYRNVQNLSGCFRNPKHKPQLVLQDRYVDELSEVDIYPRSRDSKYVVTNWDDLNIAGLEETYSTKFKPDVLSKRKLDAWS